MRFNIVEHAVMAAMHNKMVAAVRNFFMSYLRPSCRNEPLCCWCGLYGVCPISGNNINRFLFDYKRGKEKTKEGICIAAMISQLKTHLLNAFQRSVGAASPTSFFSIQPPEAGDASGGLIALYGRGWQKERGAVNHF